MVPVHDTDVAEERWTQAEWEHYELWEQIESRLRRRRLMWIFAVVILFLAISAVPVVRERLPKWSVQLAARRFTQDINEIKRRALLTKRAYQIRFESPASDRYWIESVANCAQGALLTGPGDAHSESRSLVGFRDLAVVQATEVSKMDRFCFDPILGAEFSLSGRELVGFAFLTAKDLSEGRTDRASALLLRGTSAEISFD